MNKRKNFLRSIGYVLTGLVLVLSVLLFVSCLWATKTFNVELQEILFTLKSPLAGADPNIVREGIEYCLVPPAFFALVYIILVYIDIMIKPIILITITTKKKAWSFNIRKFFRKTVVVLTSASFIASFVYAETQYQIIDFVKSRLSTTTIYEDYYVHPDSVNIRADGDEKNLLCIYLESMETTYASTEEGGAQPVNYIPNLTRFAKENISFSSSDKLGGFYTPKGTTWTVAALLATTSGIPFSFPVAANSMNKRETFASGLTNLGDILSKHNYNQYFLCGSNADFAGRKSYFQQHGNYSITDLFVAREKGYIPKKYYTGNWGFEDAKLYDIAKKELTQIYQRGERFNYTMLTVDTHFPDGYICELCTSEYDSIAANAISCADRQITEFLNWCKEQPFYEDTAIVITGDHFRMDLALVENANSSQRKVYNCFINCGESSDFNTTNRCFNALDMFPTLLSAMGFEIDGDRIGLGTNMFSDKPTLTEELGYDFITGELSKYSKYYVDNFS